MGAELRARPCDSFCRLPNMQAVADATAYEQSVDKPKWAKDRALRRVQGKCTLESADPTNEWPGSSERSGTTLGLRGYYRARSPWQPAPAHPGESGQCRVWRYSAFR